MFEQILIRFRGGPVVSNKDEEDESDDNSSDTTTSASPPASEAAVGRETLQLPFSRSMAFKLSPSPSIARSPSPTNSTSSTSSSSSSSTTNNSETSQLHSVAKHIITPNHSSSSLNSATMTTVKQTRKTAARHPTRKSTRAKPAQSPQSEEGESSRGQKRKASEMTLTTSDATTQVVSEAPPGKRVTRAEAKKKEEDNKIVTRSGRRLRGVDPDHQGDNGPLARTGSIKRKSPFLEPSGHQMKRPTSRIRGNTRSPGSTHGGSEAQSDDDDQGDDDSHNKHSHDAIASGSTKAPIKTKTTRPDGAATNKKPKKASKTSQSPNPANNAVPQKGTSDGADESKKRKLHQLLRVGPDNVGFPWWQDDSWLKEEQAAKRKRRLDYDTEIVLIDVGDENEDAEKSASKSDAPRQLRSAAARKSPAASPPPQVATSVRNINVFEPEALKIEKYEFPAHINLDALPKRDPLPDSRYARPHEIKRKLEKADHTKEAVKEGKNFTKYLKLLSDLEGAEGNEWMEVIGVDPPENRADLGKLLKKKDRLVEELNAARRRYPIYKHERNMVENGESDPSYAALLRNTNQEPLSIKGRFINWEDVKKREQS